MEILWQVELLGSPFSLDVDMGEALGLLHAMQWVIELKLVNMDFETDCKSYGR